jgi:uncharacterized protein YcbK (DUF882 family)
MRLNEWFKREEFRCQCGCGFDTVDVDLLEVLTNVREHFKAPVHITSGCRCTTHNFNAGGSKHSQHTIGKASDFQVRGVSPKEVYEYIDSEYPHTLGLGLYSSWVHVDSRENKARWRG